MKQLWPALVAILTLLQTPVIVAEELPRLAVLEFELNDLTLKPRTPEELERTASLAPMLRTALRDKYRYTLMEIPPDARRQADVAFGYLYSHPDLAADLGQRYGVDWIVVGRLHKPSFLFAYMQVRLINVAQRKVLRDSLVEVKGALPRLNQRGIEQVAAQINETISPTTMEHTSVRR